MTSAGRKHSTGQTAATAWAIVFRFGCLVGVNTNRENPGPRPRLPRQKNEMGGAYTRLNRLVGLLLAAKHRNSAQGQ